MGASISDVRLCLLPHGEVERLVTILGVRGWMRCVTNTSATNDTRSFASHNNRQSSPFIIVIMMEHCIASIKRYVVAYVAMAE